MDRTMDPLKRGAASAGGGEGGDDDSTKSGFAPKESKLTEEDERTSVQAYRVSKEGEKFFTVTICIPGFAWGLVVFSRLD